jgi:hypothetical protein
MKRIFVINTHDHPFNQKDDIWRAFEVDDDETLYNLYMGDENQQTITDKVKSKFCRFPSVEIRYFDEHE